MSPRKPTIREVADRAGVSIGTVSHVLTGRKAVRPVTRAAIDAAIRDLAYVPDSAARALIARRGRAAARHQPGTPRLTTVGYLCADHTARVDVLPHRDDRIRAESIEKTLGGAAANVAVTAAGLGPPLAVAAELLSVIGDDADSDWATGMLAARRVGLHPLSRRPGGRLSRCFILVEANGSRTIVNEPLQVPAPTLQHWLETTPSPASVHTLHLQGDQVDALAGLLPAVRAQGFRLSMQTTSIAPAWRSPEGLARLRHLFDLVVLTRDLARDMLGGGFRAGTGDLVRRTDAAVREPGAMVALTLGAEGAALLAHGGPPLRVEAPLAEPVDSTGAGDTFTGLFLAAWVNGRDLDAALRLAVAGASRSIAVPGAQEHGLAASDLLGQEPLAAE